jgi:hypothetical protein
VGPDDQLFLNNIWEIKFFRERAEHPVVEMSYLNFEIDPEYLSDDQISYELRIRSLQPNENQNP